jgi:hypothetical protein
LLPNPRNPKPYSYMTSLACLYRATGISKLSSTITQYTFILFPSESVESAAVGQSVSSKLYRYIAYNSIHGHNEEQNNS